ncbi:AfsR/SARP family transcriptional regulator [Yinghuangia seranimata]|uniref:AfsR/SARP family transcriptional regulator n=1 Tax=Yinghuangia seranimata TaxID=408067 RepID=UPI00248BA4D3|nr:BTAD domain-containing putative transcriptional regulator [Yinghuangia seranimata]MDI2125183.1 BTAD domain-containing putative transcriptional regulator [Yinghuangia seranimata]
MHVSVLGPLQVRDDEGEPLAVTGARLRVLLVRLALDTDRPVPADLLVRAVWDEDEPAGAANALQSLVSRLRRMLGPGVITSEAGGYRLAVDRGAVDAHAFERAAAEGRRLLAAGDPAAAEAALTRALALWHGTALADATDRGFAAGPAARLEELRLTALEDRADARLRLGRVAETVPELEQLTAEHPLRERLHGQLIVALDTVGRRADALAAYQAVRTTLADELGIDPSPELDELHMAVLRGDRRTAAIPAAGRGGAATAPGGGSGGAAGRLAASGAAGAGPGAGPAGASGALGGGAAGQGANHPAPGGGSVGASQSQAGPQGRVASAGAPGGGLLETAASGGFAGANGAASPTNLTTRLTSFVGRDDDRDRLTRMLGQARLVSVVGPGGAGKTRITVETGTRLLPAFPGGVWFVELAPVHDPLDIPQAILSALGRREVGILGTVIDTPSPAADRDPLERVVEVLERRSALLILDNCEHLVAAAADVTDQLLARTPGLRVLTSTREPLGILGEALYPLGPLELPPPHADPDDAVKYPAVRLFADRAEAVRPNLVIDASNVGAVVEICRRLDGMPLAIELAAARTRSLPPEQIARRLDDRFRLLTGGSRTAMPRHQTLRAVVEWSWDLLDEREHAVLRRLSVFAGGATIDAAESVIPDGDLILEEDVLDLLAGLVDKSLVEVFGTGEPRYRMLETIAAFAAEQRAVNRADAGVMKRHSDWCLAILERTDPELRSRDQLRALRVISDEHDNIAVALRAAIDAGQAERAVRLVAGLGWYWSIRGYHGEAAAWMAEALEVPGEVPAIPLISAQWFYGMTRAVTGFDPQALRWLMKARWGLRHIPPDVPIPPVLRLIPPLSAAARDYSAGTFQYMKVLASGEDDPWVLAFIDLIGGHLAVNGGMTEEGLLRLRRARSRFVQIGDRWGRSSAVAGLSEVYAYTGRAEEAMAAMEECLQLVRELGADEDVPMILMRRGMLRVLQGDAEGALADLDEAMAIAGRAETAGGVMLGYLGRGDLARLLGDNDEAAYYLDLAEREVPNTWAIPPQLIARMHMSIAYLAEERGEHGKSRIAVDTACDVATDGRDMPIVAAAAETLAWWAYVEGDDDYAALMLGAAVALRGHADLGSPDAVRTTENVRARMPEERFEARFERGRTTPQNDAFELVRKGTDGVGRAAG